MLQPCLLTGLLCLGAWSPGPSLSSPGVSLVCVCSSVSAAAFTWEVKANDHAFNCQFKEKVFLCRQREKYKVGATYTWLGELPGRAALASVVSLWVTLTPNSDPTCHIARSLSSVK